MDNTRLVILEMLMTWRVLTHNQLYLLVLEENTPVERERLYMIIDELIADKLVTTNQYKSEQIALQITDAGLKVYYKFGEPESLGIVDGVVTSIRHSFSDINLDTKIINHNIHLNYFAMELMSLLHVNNGLFNNQFNLMPEYYDEKDFAAMYKQFGFRPDGVIKYQTNVENFLFLEMDMSTESKKDLIGKWEKYEQLVKEFKQTFGEKTNIKILFITNTESRCQVSKVALSEYFAEIATPQIDVFVDTHQNLIKKIKVSGVFNFALVDYKKVPIFTKSFARNDTPMQHFGYDSHEIAGFGRTIIVDYRLGHVSILGLAKKIERMEGIKLIVIIHNEDMVEDFKINSEIKSKFRNSIYFIKYRNLNSHAHLSEHLFTFRNNTKVKFDKAYQGSDH